MLNYSTKAVDAAVEYISEHNPAFLGRHEYIRQAITNQLGKLSDDPDPSAEFGTMGFLLQKGGDGIRILLDMDILTAHSLLP